VSYDLLSTTKPIARKEHRCIWCGQKIVKGERYLAERSVFDGEMQNHHWHFECNEACLDENAGESEWEFEPYGNQRPVPQGACGQREGVRKHAIKILLAVLNSRWLNQSPCRYDFVGNLDNFSRSDIEYSLKADPNITLREYLAIADRFKSCPISRIGITAIEADGTYTENVDFR
jgi:hypothetical protein